MSFDEDPFKHLSVYIEPGSQRIAWECHSCGARHFGPWSLTTTIHAVRTAFLDHITGSHGRTERDFEGWS